MSRFTNYLAIDVKAEDEKAGDLPVLRKTPQMLAAGWGGSGSLMQDLNVSYSLETPMFSRSFKSAYSKPIAQYSVINLEDLARIKLNRFIERLNRLQVGSSGPLQDIESIADLEDHGIQQEMVGVLWELVDDGVDEKVVVTLFIYLLSHQKRVKKRLSRSAKRILTKSYKQLPSFPAEVEKQLMKAIEKYL
jgi:Ca-activated chloride channel family protein